MINQGMCIKLNVSKSNILISESFIGLVTEGENAVAPDAREKRKHEYLRFGKRKHEYLRFGKRKHEYLRFGRK